MANGQVLQDAVPDLSAAVTHLRINDEKLRTIIELVGPCRLAENRDGFSHLCRAIIHQQLSKAAADSILRKFSTLFGDAPATPTGLLRLEDKQFQNASISSRKTAFLRDLAENIKSRRVVLSSLPHLKDKDVIDTLMTIKGVGPWTAQMYLIFVLKRLDILPLGDAGLRRAFRQVYGLKDETTERRVHSITRKWTPYRSVGSWYLWAFLDRSRPSRPGW